MQCAVHAPFEFEEDSSTKACLPPEDREGEAWTEDCCLCLVTPRARVCTMPSPLLSLSLSLSLLWSPRYKCGVSRSRSCLSRSPAAGDHNLASPLSPILPEPEPGWCQSPRYDGGGHTRSGNTWTRSIGGRWHGVTRPGDKVLITLCVVTWHTDQGQWGGEITGVITIQDCTFLGLCKQTT